MTKYARLELNYLMLATSQAFSDLLNSIPSNVILNTFNYDNAGATVFYFTSDDFKFNMGVYPEPKWNGSKLDFTDCWDSAYTNKVINYAYGTSNNAFNNQYIGNWASVGVSDNKITPDPAYCFHVWKKYVGVMDNYEYCERCDKKK